MIMQRSSRYAELDSMFQDIGECHSLSISKKVLHMLAYQTMLVWEARRCGSGGWATYNTAF